MSKTYGVGIAGLGTVGSGFLKQLKNFKTPSQKTANINVIKIAVKNLRKKRSLSVKSLPLTTDTMSLATNDNVDILIELIGGSKGIAYKVVKKALQNKKHVITANKALLAVHGNELSKIAEQNNVCLNYEAAIAGGIPIVKAVRENPTVGDQETLHLMLGDDLGRTIYMREIPNEYNWLRVQLVNDNQDSVKKKIMHWTGPKGNMIIKEKIKNGVFSTQFTAY